MSDPKLAPLSASAWPDVLADLENGFAGQLNVYRTMAHHPALVQAWANLRQHVVLDTSLGRDRSEVVILRAAVTLNSDYEWSHHVHRARALGFSDARIAALRGPTSDMNAEDAVIAGAVDEVLALARLTPGTLAALTDLVGSKGVLDLFATVGFYSTLGFIVNTFSTPIDDEIAQSLQADPLEATAQ
ncbi:carboxymuconolactone decarboxylase family protein [Gymnodinialimonas ceratoperidinii]|uniref:Carboxymuconolactone decarboxylase family protein n=1 Tax=Gymnodinialimonas ceratoperidinii TaxID=2856823 RepID=A0A8F6TYJ8_9RHOB|nr:carboxymuconolactone decarboxylase family protein [Gymnodinialimonas ceratoperidinii]QXT41070.1 carboxymuconolactone decarboxylase family protein [Gymnodinialimonas ceratoperidinii]